MSVVFEGVDMPTACCFVDGEHSVFAHMEYCKFYDICKHRDTVKNNYRPDDCPVKLLKQDPTEKIHSKTCGTCRYFRKHRNKRNIELCKELYGENTTCGSCTYWEDSYEVALPTTEYDYCSHHREVEE